jgi:hypothetical protein
MEARVQWKSAGANGSALLLSEDGQLKLQTGDGRELTVHSSDVPTWLGHGGGSEQFFAPRPTTDR